MNMTIKQTAIYGIAQQAKAQFEEFQGWQVVQSYGNVEGETAVSQTHVSLSDRSHSGKIRVEGKTAGVMLQADELAIGGSKQTDVGTVYRLRQDLFFVRGGGEAARSFEGAGAVALTQQAAASSDLITVTDVTHGNAELWLTGPKSAELLSRLCGLDFHDSQFPSGVAKQSSVAKTSQIIICQDLGELPSYALIGSRSLAAYLWQTILQAGKDLSIQPVGIEALQSR